jgi:hypothetical protein
MRGSSDRAPSTRARRSPPDSPHRSGKFSNVELYEFMSEVLTAVYRSLPQQATTVAKLAQAQLAFERQEPVRSLIQSDY